MTATFCTSGSIKLKAGANRSSHFDSGTPAGMTATAACDELINQAESFINTTTRINYTDTYSGLNGDSKKILEDTASCHAAMSIINYDMSGYTDRAEAQTMLDVLYTKIQDNIRLLKEKQHTDFITGA